MRSAAFTVILLTANLVTDPLATDARLRDSPASQQENKSELPAQSSAETSEKNISPPGNSDLVLRDGTSVRLRFVQPVISSQVIAGDTVDLQIVEPILLGKVTVIAKSAPAKATVTLAQAKRALGRGGNLQLRIDSVLLADGKSVPLRALKDVKGGENKGEIVGGVVIAGLLFWPAAPFFFFVEGKNATIPAGTEITAYINGDISLDRAKFPSASEAPMAIEKNLTTKERSGPQ